MLYSLDITYLQQKIFLWATVFANALLQLPSDTSTLLTMEKVTSIGLLIIAVVYLEWQLRLQRKRFKEILENKDKEIKELQEKILSAKDEVIGIMRKR